MASDTRIQYQPAGGPDRRHDQQARDLVQSLIELHEISSDSESESGLDKKIAKILALGAERFDLPIAVVGRIANDRYTIEHIVNPGKAPKKGDSFKLEDVYCALTANADRPLGFENVSNSELRDYPMYAALGLECYLGVRIDVDDKPYGTLGFADLKARHRPFSGADLAFLQILAVWIGKEISLHETQVSLRLSDQAIEHATTGVVIADARRPDTPIIYANPAFEKMSGYPPEEYLGKNCRFLQGTDRDQPGRHRIRKALRENRPVREIIKNYRKDGGLIWLDIAISPILNDAGRTTHFVGFQTDITEQIFAQDALKHSEERFRSAIESLRDGFALFNADDRLIVCNDKYRRLHPGTKDFINPGIRFEDLVRRNLNLGFIPVAVGYEEEFVRKRLEQHRNPSEPIVREFADGSWYIIADSRTSDGGYCIIQTDITDVKRIETALRFSEERFRGAVESLQEAFALFDSNDRLVIFNEEYRRLHPTCRDILKPGTRFEDIVRCNVKAGVIAEAIGREEEHIRERLTQHRNPRGPIIRSLTNGLWYIINEGRTADGGYCVTQTDITPLKQIEKDLRRSQERLDYALEGAHEILWDWHIGDGDLYIDPRLELQLGYPQGTIEPHIRVLQKLLHPEDRRHFQRHLDDYLANKTPVYEDEFRLLTKSGSSLWLHSRGAVMEWDQDKKPVRLVGTLRDITDRKKAEEDLRKQNDMIKLLHRAAATANEAQSSEQAMRSCLSDICSFTGWPAGHIYLIDSDDPGTLISSKIWHIDNPQRFQSFREVTENAVFKTGIGLPGKVLACGKPIWRIVDTDRLSEYTRLQFIKDIEIGSGFAFPIFIGTEIIAVMEFFTGETVRPNTFLIRILSDIGAQIGRVFEREDAEKRLRAAKEEADRANQAKSDFLSSMSHELRTPMNAILGFSQLLDQSTKDPLSKAQRKYVQQILKSGNHLLELIRGVLELSKIEAGKMELTIESVDPRDIIDECLSLSRILAKDMNVRIKDETERQNLPHIRSDKMRFLQSLLNLSSNAIKYNVPNGSVTFSVEQSPPGFARFIVSDTGTGIPNERQHELFEPFVRLDKNNSDVEGTGIGLTITKSIVELMDGRVGFASREGEGSSFWIDMPLASPRDPVMAQPKTPRNAPIAAALETTDTIKILYVEDDPTNLRLMEAVLGQIPNITMLSAHTAELGLKLASEIKPDLIFMDINLPGMDGYQALKELGGMPELRDIPVIALSADAMPQDIERGLKAGFTQYMTKPIQIGRIRSAIGQALKTSP